MRNPNLLHQALYFGPLALGAVTILLAPSRTLAPGAVFLILAVYAHAAARVIGVTGLRKAMLCLEALPFFGLATACLGKLEAIPALLAVSAGAVAGAALLAGEWLLVKGTPTFTTSMGFIAACCLAGLGLAALPAMAFLGLALLALTLAGLGVARRVCR